MEEPGSRLCGCPSLQMHAAVIPVLIQLEIP